VVGGLQTVMISRAVCEDDPRLGNPRREVFAQGMANLSAAFTGGFAGSGSFNRTAAHVKAGAQTRLAGVMSSVFLLAMAWIAGPLFAYIALPAVAGTIALIGWGMLRSGLLGFWPDRGFPRAAALGAVVSALVVGVESSLTLVTLLGFLSLVLAHRRTPAATPKEPTP
jgi:SulP family sulfate permease